MYVCMYVCKGAENKVQRSGDELQKQRKETEAMKAFDDLINSEILIDN